MALISISTVDVDLSDINSHLSAAQIAEHFNIEATKINQIFQTLKWIEKEYDIWWIATVLGKKNGAIECIHDNGRVKYVHWTKSILKNVELQLAVEQYIHTYKNDRAYKNFIGKYYLKEGYTVWNHTEDKGLNDRNINYIAKKNRDVFLINCRANPIDITIEEIKTFEEQKNAFVLENPIFSYYNITMFYNMAGFYLSEDAFWYVKENKMFDFQILKQN